ncbi:MAG: hypothetical protein Q9165_005854 [Trypethelium subeluteriae]
MFLLEGNGKAVLYTGDVRAETWWCQQLARHPVLLPYAKSMRTLDCIYLDTTFAVKKDIFRQFPSKRDGIHDLLNQIRKYPDDTVFHFDTWTFGYEEVWIALTTALNCKIHVDRYRAELYNNLGTTYPSAAAAVLAGFQYANRFQRGCLTQDPHPRIHSCERGTPCPIFEDNRKVVRVLPIISRFEDGTEMEERGAGGGFGDLKEAHELEITDNESFGQLMSICAASIQDAEKLAKVLGMLVAKIPEKGSSKLALTTNLPITDDMSLRDFVPVLAEIAEGEGRDPRQISSLRPSNLPTSHESTSNGNAAELPELIVNPHSYERVSRNHLTNINSRRLSSILRADSSQRQSPGPLLNSLGNSSKTGDHLEPGEISETTHPRRKTKLDFENPEQAFRRKVWISNSQLHSRHDGLKSYQALRKDHPDVKRFRIQRKDPLVARRGTLQCASTALALRGPAALALQAPAIPTIPSLPGPSMHFTRQRLLREPVPEQPAEQEQPSAIRIGNLSQSTTGEDVRHFLGRFSAEYVQLAIRHSTLGDGMSIEALVNMPSLREAQTAIKELQGKMLMGRQVRIWLTERTIDRRLGPRKSGANREPLHKARNLGAPHTNTAGSKTGPTEQVSPGLKAPRPILPPSNPFQLLPQQNAKGTNPSVSLLRSAGLGTSRPTDRPPIPVAPPDPLSGSTGGNVKANLAERVEPKTHIPGLHPLTWSWSDPQPSPSERMVEIQEGLRALQASNRGRSSPSAENRLITRQHSYNAAQCRNGTNWQSGIGLSSTGGSVRDFEEEL